ncbi:MAG: TolB family protein [Solirubrobacterales bacterium]
MLARGKGLAGLILAAIVLVAIAAPAVAEAPPGPRLAVVRATRGHGIELVTVNAKGTRPSRLAGGGRRARPLLDFFSPISWGPSGADLVFAGIIGFRDGDGADPIQKLFSLRADGSGLASIPGTEGGEGPVVSPDGHTLAFTRRIQEPSPTRIGGKYWEEGFDGSSIWTVDLAGGPRRQLTPWRSGVRYVASSFSPDGSTLLATVEDELRSEPQPVIMDLGGQILERVYDDGSSPVFSPDGKRIALIRETEDFVSGSGEDSDLYVINADGTGLRRLTRTPGRLELSPSWDPSGERLAYVRLPLVRSEDAPFGYGNSLMEINADGSCQTKVRTPSPSLYFSPTWQPGPGREAGRITC